MKIPGELKYTRSHEWVRLDGDEAIVGITDHAQDALGDIVFVEAPEPGVSVERGGELCVVESTKAASDVYAPVDGQVIAANDALEEAPELVNSDPYGDGWLARLRPSDLDQLGELLDAAAYKEHLGA